MDQSMLEMLETLYLALTRIFDGFIKFLGLQLD